MFGGWYVYGRGHGGQGTRRVIGKACVVTAVANLVARLQSRRRAFSCATYASMLKQSSISDAYALLGLEQVGKLRDQCRVLNPPIGGADGPGPVRVQTGGWLSSVSTRLSKENTQLALRTHPDKNQGNAEATAQFQQISEAYTVLQSHHAPSEPLPYCPCGYQHDSDYDYDDYFDDDDDDEFYFYDPDDESDEERLKFFR